MGLIEKVRSELQDADYNARECVETRRQQLEWQSRKYCMLSHPSVGAYCPLQAEADSGVALAECRRDDYIRELVARNPTIARRNCDKG